MQSSRIPQLPNNKPTRGMLIARSIIETTLREAPASFFSIGSNNSLNRGDEAFRSGMFVRIERDNNRGYAVTLPKNSQLKTIPPQIQRAVNSLNNSSN